MRKLNFNSVQILSASILDFFSIQDYKDILQFSLEDIDLSGDVSSDKSRLDFENSPYMIQPLSRCTIEEGKRKTVCIMWADQMGKTTVQLCSLLHSVVYNELQALIAYPSLDLAVQTSNTKFIPLFKKIPQFAQEIEKPFAIRSDRLKLSNALIYWLGAGGGKIASRSAKLVLGDQCAIWETPKEVNNINELKKRTRSYNQCLQLFVSTPHYKEDNFYREWLMGSQAYYYLRCKSCGKLTMRSCDIHNLQFQTVYDSELKQYICVRGSERLICPQCKFEHSEEDREFLIKNGAYIHTFPERAELTPSYQAGVLASLLNAHSWSIIADVQLSAGKGSTLETFVSFDNSYRGLPFQGREFNKQDENVLKKHFYKKGELKPELWEAVYVVADTQDTFSPYAVVALDKNSNFWVLEMGRKRYLWLDDEQRKIIDSQNQRNGKPPEITLEDIAEKQYYGLKPLMLFVDMRGHRSQQIKNFCKLRKNYIMYAGTSLKYDKWKISDNNNKLFLCDARKYQAELIFMLYFQQNRENNYIYLPDDLSQQDIEEITSFQPDETKRNGNLYENWLPGKNGQAIHDSFDVLKMTISAVQISGKIYRKSNFKFGEAKILNPQTMKKPLNKKPKNIIAKNPLFRH